MCLGSGEPIKRRIKELCGDRAKGTRDLRRRVLEDVIWEGSIVRFT